MSRIQLERLLKIDGLIRKPERQVAATLAEALEVSDRTVQDDLAFVLDRCKAVGVGLWPGGDRAGTTGASGDGGRRDSANEL